MTSFIYEQLAQRFSEQIHTGLWRPQQRLPSIRQLSEEFGVAKITVQHALHKLEASGLVEARPRSGYFVCQRSVPAVPSSKRLLNTQPSLVNMPLIFQDIMARSAAFDLCPGAPVNEPASHLLQLNRHIGRAMRQQLHHKALYYTGPQGNPALREQIALLYQGRNCPLDAEALCITAGCQNSLFLALMSCCEPGDTVAVESPAFYGVLQLLQQLQLKVVEIPVSPTLGLKAADLEAVVRKWPVKACVITASFATPTGSSIPGEEKRQLVALADQYGLTLIEDDIYGDLGFHFRPEPLKAFDKNGSVILCSSISKSLSRDLRLGWIAGGRHHDKIVHLKLINQLASGQAIQEGLASFMAEGHYKRHLLQYRQQLKRQRDDLLKALNELWQFPFRYTVPEGGIALWLELQKQQNTSRYYQPLLKENIVITPGALFSTQGHFNNYLRLSFAHPVTGSRRQALARLAGVFAGGG